MLLWPLPTGAQKGSDLQNQKQALLFELAHVQNAPGVFYLLIDLSTQVIQLKADGNILRTCPILNHTLQDLSQTTMYHFVARKDPVTSEPGNTNMRHRGRRFPLDFFTRLTEGPRHHSRLYFNPTLLLQSADLPQPSIPCILLASIDIKALGSALQKDDIAILIPQHEEASP